MLSYLQKPAVQMTLFIVAVGTAGAFFYLQGDTRNTPAPTKPPPAGMGQASAEKVPVGRRDLKGSETVENTRLDKLVLPPIKPEPPTVVKEVEKPKAKEKPKAPVFPDLVQVRSSESMKPFAPANPEVFAPRGTLIKAALVITLESNANGTPVLAMVSEDVYFQGKLIVPAGTQVMAASATAASNANSRFRDRIDVRGAFTFIWADGSEYVINGIALDHEPLPDGTFGITDGSPGIRGRILKTDDYAELKILVSEALQGVLKSQQTSFQSIYGLVPDSSRGNSTINAGAGGASAYSSLLVKKLEKDLEYVQVSAGTSFYIYTTDVFEPELRSIGGLRQGNTAKSGIEMQEESYSKMAAAVLKKAEEMKAQLEGDRVLDSAAKQQALIERTQALLAPMSSQDGGVPPPRTPSTNPAKP